MHALVDMLFTNIRCTQYIFSCTGDGPDLLFRDLKADCLGRDDLQAEQAQILCQGGIPMLVVQYDPRVMGYATAKEAPDVIERYRRNLKPRTVMLARLNTAQLMSFRQIMWAIFEGESFEKRIGPGKLRRSFELHYGQHMTEIYLGKQALPGIAMSA